MPTSHHTSNPGEGSPAWFFQVLIQPIAFQIEDDDAPMDLGTLGRFFRVLGDPTRVRVL
jgi:hypothetical protein